MGAGGQRTHRGTLGVASDAGKLLQALPKGVLQGAVFDENTEIVHAAVVGREQRVTAAIQVGDIDVPERAAALSRQDRTAGFHERQRAGVE